MWRVLRTLKDRSKKIESENIESKDKLTSDVEGLTRSLKETVTTIRQETSKEIEKFANSLANDIQGVKKRVADTSEMVDNIKNNINETHKKTYAEMLSEVNEKTKELKSNLQNEFKNDIEAENKKIKKDIEKLQERVTLKVSEAQHDIGGVEPTITEMEEREKRKFNFLIFGVEESAAPTGLQRKAEDLVSIKNTIKQISNDIPTDNIQHFRLGRHADNSLRPIKVILPSKVDAQNVLRNKNKVKSDEGIYIKYDLTELQRKFRRSLLQELENRSAGGENNLRIRYLGGCPKIVKDHVKAQTHNNAPKN